MDLRNLRPGEWLAGLAGGVLTATLFLPWYEPPAGDSVTAWEAFTVTDVVLDVSGLFGIALLVLTAQQRTAAVPIALAAITSLVALAAAVLAMVRLLNPPGSDLTLEVGAYLGLAAVLCVGVGAYISMRSEGFGVHGSGYTGPRRAKRPVPIDVDDAPAPPRTGG